MLHTASEWAVLIVISLIAGLVRGFAGFGGPSVMILLLVPFYTPVSVLSKVVLIDLFANLKLLPAALAQVDWRLGRVLITVSVLAAPIGMLSLQVIEPAVMRRLIAAIAAGGTLLMMLGLRFKTMPSVWLTALVAAAAGFILGATLIAYMAVVYVMATPAKATQARAVLILWGLPTSLVIIATHVWLGNIDWSVIWRSALVGIFYVLGTIAGAWLFSATSDASYRRFVLWFLFALASVGLLI